MPQTDIAARIDPPNETLDHRGASSTTLSGSRVVLVWIASVLVHIVLLAILFNKLFPFAHREPNAVPDARVELVGNVDASTFTPRDDSPTLDSPILQDPLETKFTPKQFQPLSELSNFKKPELSIVGVGTGGGADLSRFGISAGEHVAPQFFGLGKSAKAAERVVYVVDRSGSMLDTFAHVRKELKRSIGTLKRGQKFHVIFFNAGEPVENPPKKLVNAITAQKKAFFDFLETIFPKGSTRPEQAMRKAIQLNPDLIYFLTDGEFDPALVDKLRQWNAQRKVQIYTIAYFDESGATLLERIAREHDGEFKFVTEHDIP